MTPSNPSNSKPLIYRICDSLGVFHIVAPVNHTHEINEVSGLTDELNELWASTNEKANAEDVTEALAEKQNTLTFDSTPTANSTNPVTSGGVKDALDSKQNTLTFDSTPTANSTNPVTSGGVKAAIDAASADPMPIIRGLSGGDSVDLDEALTQPNTMARFIILNEYANDYALPLWDIFYSNTLPVHKSGSENDELPNGEYLLATVFRINSSQHTHQNCYFVSFDSIFSE